MADVLRTSLSDLDVQVEPRLVLPSTGLSVSVIPANPPRETQMAAMGELGGGYLIDVLARASMADSEATQDILIDMLDDQHDLSVAAALDADPTLGGWATDTYFDPDASVGLGLVQVPDGPAMIGCSWRFMVVEAVS